MSLSNQVQNIDEVGLDKFIDLIRLTQPVTITGKESSRCSDVKGKAAVIIS